MDSTSSRETPTGFIYQINISRGGVPKLPIATAKVTANGLAGDWHNDEQDHGGPMKALCLYTLEQIERLASEGHPIYPGATGENITLRDIPLGTLTPGVRLALGESTLVEITKYAAPCTTIADSFNNSDFTRISQKLHPGESRVYARVLREGELHVGDRVSVMLPETSEQEG